MGSDGIFDFMNVDEICNKVIHYYDHSDEICGQVIAEKIIDDIRRVNITKSKQCDNLSLIIIFLNRGYNRFKYKLNS